MKNKFRGNNMIKDNKDIKKDVKKRKEKENYKYNRIYNYFSCCVF